MPARQNRITRGDDYRRIVRTGRRVGDACCIVHAVFSSGEDVGAEDTGSGAPARFGFIVSKAVGNAVTRNLVRRRLKTIADRQLQGGLAGVDIVIRALPASAETPFPRLEHEVDRALARLRRMREATS